MRIWSPGLSPEAAHVGGCRSLPEHFARRGVHGVTEGGGRAERRRAAERGGTAKRGRTAKDRSGAEATCSRGNKRGDGEPSQGFLTHNFKDIFHRATGFSLRGTESAWWANPALQAEIRNLWTKITSGFIYFVRVQMRRDNTATAPRTPGPRRREWQGGRHDALKLQPGLQRASLNN